MIIIERASIVQAASELKIKPSTAKYILRCYRRKGAIMKKNSDEMD